MARGTQPSPRIRSTTIITTIVTTLLTTSLASLPVPTDSREVPQGCSLHPHEKLVSCRGVNTTLLQDFLLQVITLTTSATTITITTTTTPPLSDNTTTTTNSTTTTPPPPNDTATTNNTTSPQQHATNTTTFATTESEDMDGNARNNSGTQRRGSSRVTELSCLGCRVPALTPTLLGPPTLPTALKRLSIVDSGVEEVLPDALASHALTLVHLDLSYNLLQTVPEAVISLTHLQVLDLRHNKIHRVAAGMVLSPLRDLRYLYLDHNQLGQTLSSSQGQRSRPSVFDLWTTEDTPPPPRLSHLGLSVNGIKEIPSEAFSRLANLLHLDLSDNFLTSLHQTDLPASILNLDLGGNPWNCTCEATWILERHAPPLPTTPLPSTTTAAAAPSTTTITSPTCFSPLHLRRRRLDLLTASEVCPSEEEASGDQVVYIGDDVEGPLRDAFRALRLLNATSLTTHALLISWRIDAAFYFLSAPPLQPVSWAVTVRDVMQDPREAHVTRLRLERYRREQPQWTPGDGLFAEVLEDLDADTAYVICLTVVQQSRLYTRPSHCLHSTTLSTPPRTAPPAVTTHEALQSYSTQDYDIRTEAFTVWSEARSASLSWNVTVLPRKDRSGALVSVENLLLRPLGWRVSFSRSGEEGEGEDEEKEVVLVSRGGELLQNFTNSYSIEGLQAGARYVFCLYTLTDEEVRESLAGGNSEKPLQDMSPSHPISSLPWETHSHTLPTTARSRSVVDPRGGAGRHDLETQNNALPAVLPPPHPNKAAAPAHSVPSTRTPVPPPGGEPPFNVPATPSSQGFIHSFPPQPPSTSASSNFPPVPPSLPPLPHSRPPRPPRPQSGGGFVYTSTGKRIPLPSGQSGLLPPFSVPPPTPVRDPGPPRGLPSRSASKPPSRQRFIYEFEETSSVPPPPSPLSSGARTQIYTYQTRRRRAVEGRKPSSFKATPMCRQVVTPAELDVVLPAAIAATISCAATVVVVLLVCCCCWPRRCCRRKGAWRSRSALDSRKVSTISAPSPVSMFSGHTSAVAGAGAGRNDGDATASRREVPGGLDKAGRSVSTTSSSGYLTPLHTPDDRGPQSQNPDPKAAYLSLMQSRLLQRHKDLPEFHPGYDIPPTASNKTLVGYDYPHPTPVNPIDGGGERPRSSATSSSQLPSPSSSDSNYNVSIGNNPEPDRNPTEVNLNIPCQQLKSSCLTKSVHVPPDVTDNSNYIYTAGEAPASTAARTYLKNPPSKARHRRLGQPQQSTEEHNSILQSLSLSTPDLITATATTEEETGSAPLNLSLRDDPSHTVSLGQPASLPPAASIVESTGYVNFPTVQEDPELSRQQGQPVHRSSSSSNSKEREPYHTWGGHPAKARPGVGEVVLSGGTLIEVPEGYVIPKTPKPTPFIRLLVRGQDGPKNLSLKAPPLPPSAHEEGGGSAHSTALGTSVTRLLTPEADHNRLVINTAMAL